MTPTFLCLGAQKSGTTTAWQLLDFHPDIFMATPRETRFFVDDDLYSSGLQGYKSTFFHGWTDEKAIGEKTPEYLFNPNAAGRIFETLGRDIRLLIFLRSPAQRAFSHYRHNIFKHWECESFETAVALEADRSARSCLEASRFGYFARGRYADQISRYLNLFPRENFLFLVFETDVRGDQAALARRMYAHLGISQNVTLPAAPISLGRPPLPQVSVSRFRKCITVTDHKMRKKVIKKASPEMLDFYRSMKKNMPKITHLDRDHELAINQTHFSDDICRVQDMTGLDLSCWLP